MAKKEPKIHRARATLTAPAGLVPEHLSSPGGGAAPREAVTAPAGPAPPRDRSEALKVQDGARLPSSLVQVGAEVTAHFYRTSPLRLVTESARVTRIVNPQLVEIETEDGTRVILGLREQRNAPFVVPRSSGPSSKEKSNAPTARR